MRFLNNAISSVSSSSVVNTLTNRNFSYMEAEGTGYVACTFSTDKKCHGDRFYAVPPTTPAFNAGYNEVHSTTTVKYQKMRVNGIYRRFLLETAGKINAFEADQTELNGLRPASSKPICAVSTAPVTVIELYRRPLTSPANNDLLIHSEFLGRSLLVCDN